MKKFLFLSILLPFCLYAFSEPLQQVKVIQFENLSEADVYNAAKMFVVDNFVSPNDVIQLDDPTQHILVVKSRFDFSTTKFGSGYSYLNGFIRFILKIEVRDGRYRVSIYDFTHHSNSLQYNDFWSVGLINADGIANQSKCKDPRIKKSQEDLIKACNDFSYLLLTRIENYINQYSHSESTDEW